MRSHRIDDKIQCFDELRRALDTATKQPRPNTDYIYTKNVDQKDFWSTFFVEII